MSRVRHPGSDPAPLRRLRTRPARPQVGWVLVGLVVVLALAWPTRYLDKYVPTWTAGTGFAKISKSIEYPVYAIVIGLLANLALTALRVRDRLSPAFRTEFFIKTGLVLLGLSINLKVIVNAAGPAIIQALVLISGVFLFTWWIAGRLGLGDKLRALLAAAVSIFLLPWLADVLGLSQAVAGAWIGGNIDTTAAVTAAGALAGDDALKIAIIVKVTQNALIGVVAVALTAYFTLRVEKSGNAARPGAGELWRRFPKFVLGFLAASAIGTWYANSGLAGAEISANTATINNLRVWFLILAFVSIGLEFRVRSLREAGRRPIAVFASATVVNILLALGLASLLFANFTL